MPRRRRLRRRAERAPVSVYVHGSRVHAKVVRRACIGGGVDGGDDHHSRRSARAAAAEGPAAVTAAPHPPHETACACALREVLLPARARLLWSPNTGDAAASLSDPNRVRSDQVSAPAALPACWDPR